MQLNDLPVAQLKTLTSQQQLDLILEIRERRRRMPERKQRRKVSAVSRRKDTKILEQMSREQMLALLKTLGG